MKRQIGRAISDIPDQSIKSDRDFISIHQIWRDFFKVIAVYFSPSTFSSKISSVTVMCNCFSFCLHKNWQKTIPYKGGRKANYTLPGVSHFTFFHELLGTLSLQLRCYVSVMCDDESSLPDRPVFSPHSNLWRFSNNFWRWCLVVCS